MRLVFAAALAVVCAACVSNPGFRCVDDTSCGTNGTCEPTHFCAFPDTSCTSTGERYGGQASPSLRGTCVDFVADAGPQPDTSGFIDGPPGTVTVQVSPQTKTMLPYTGVVFGATVSGASDKTVSWSVVESNGGSVDANGQYVAGQFDGTYHVRATSNSDPTKHADVTVTVSRNLTPVVIAHGGTVTAPTGQSTQQHLFETTTGQWWLDYQSSTATDRLLTRTSSDFTTWTDGNAAIMPNTASADGRDMTASVQKLPNAEVMQVLIGAVDQDVWEIKGVLSAGSVTWGSYHRLTGSGQFEPDGASILVTHEGETLAITGWEGTPPAPPLSCGTGDDDLYTANSIDDGTANFSSVSWTEQILWCVPNVISARQLLEDASGNIYHLIPDSAESNPILNILLLTRGSDRIWHPIQPASGSPVPPTRVFSTDTDTDTDAFEGILFEGELQIIRFRTNGTTFEHRTFDLGNGNLFDGGTIPPAPTMVPGMYLGHYGEGFILVTIDNIGTFHYTWFFDGSWSPWVALAAPTSVSSRAYLAGYDPVDHGSSALIWTELGSSDNTVMGALLPQ
jgi:hypothetical protein